MTNKIQILRCPQCGRLESIGGPGVGPVPLGWAAAVSVPMASAAHNLREVAKELVLLERHWLCPGELCADCIRKHLLCAEALTQEAGTLNDAEQWAPTIASLAGYIADLERDWLAGHSPNELGQRARALRKALAPRVFDRG